MTCRIRVYDQNGKNFVLGAENENGFTAKLFQRHAAVVVVSVLLALGFTAEVIENGKVLKVPA